MQRFNKKDAALLLIDLQERLVPAMDNQDALLRYSKVLLKLAETYKIPVFVSEQYPKGLGPTVPELKAELNSARIVAKTRFTAYLPEIEEGLKQSGAKQIIVIGAETHICVYQTVLDLLAAGYEVFVPYDAVASRTPENKANALSNMQIQGAVVTNTETLLFEALEEAGTAEFKDLSALIR